jgi:Skp family chaperone for outer membrane proteins
MRLALPLLLATLVPSVAMTQEEKPLAVATIDVSYIFKNHKPVAGKLAPLRDAVQELEKTVQLRQVEIDQVQRKLAAPKEGDDRAKLQQQLIKLQTELRVFVEKERQSLQKRELDIQAEVYKDVQAEVKKLAKERGLKLVLVRPRGSLETDDLGELNRTLNQLGIYEEGLDITDAVLKALAAKAESDQ